MVGIDADTGTVEEHERELDRALSAAELGKRMDDEAIALLIPKRNIETWVLCLSGTSVDELTDYKSKSNIDRLVKPVASTLFQWSREAASVPTTCIPSLRKGLVEMRRVD